MEKDLELKNKLIQLLLLDDYTPYNKIIENLNVSPRCVLSQIKSLKKLGYKIEFDKNKGYHLVSKTEIISAGEIKKYLRIEVTGKDVIYFGSLFSTNIYARKIAEKGAHEGTLVIADTQTHGHGRKNRIWFSSFGGLWFSVVLRPNILPSYCMLLTMAASVSVAQAIKEITGLDPVIKWPNDILINGKKVCGILCEVENTKKNIDFVVVGIGINVNNKIDNTIKKTATSLSIEAGSNISRVKFLRCVIKYFDKNYKKLVKEDYNYIRGIWLKFANIIGRSVLIKDYGNNLSGTISDVDIYGHLVLKNEKGTYKIFSGDIFYF